MLRITGRTSCPGTLQFTVTHDHHGQGGSAGGIIISSALYMKVIVGGARHGHVMLARRGLNPVTLLKETLTKEEEKEVQKLE
ncbi:hypothetical protein E2C01_089964 [Portunus trituberculatus]|uniref:Uncharacterized protein n=1 Tax=Portunus trituberculatus TaxID=210409 RepID=A0A5B7JJ10_PORTR|nr:hypothetical protein [Portunus trituberculatus]